MNTRRSMGWMQDRGRGDRGASLVEYVLFVALFVAAVVGPLGSMGREATGSAADVQARVAGGEDVTDANGLPTP